MLKSHGLAMPEGLGGRRKQNYMQKLLHKKHERIKFFKKKVFFFSFKKYLTGILEFFKLQYLNKADL